MSEKEELRKSWERELPISLRILKAFPAGSENFKPHEKSQTAIQIASMFVNAQQASQRILAGTFTPVPNFPPAPGSWSELIAAFESDSAKYNEMLKKAEESDIERPIKIVDPYAGRLTEMKEVPGKYFLWFLLNDHIHHRGQLSVYLRLAGGQVPSIYGPSADDRWR